MTQNPYVLVLHPPHSDPWLYPKDNHRFELLLTILTMCQILPYSVVGALRYRCARSFYGLFHLIHPI